MMPQHLFHEVFCEDDLLAHVGTASALPGFACGFFDAASGVGDVRSDSQSDVAGEGPRRGGPRQDGGVVVHEFEFHVNRWFFHFFVAQSDFVA